MDGNTRCSDVVYTEILPAITKAFCVYMQEITGKNLPSGNDNAIFFLIHKRAEELKCIIEQYIDGERNNFVRLSADTSDHG